MISGGRRSGYHELVGGTHTIAIANLAPEESPDYLFDLEKSFPLAGESVDHVLLMNVLEHVFATAHVLRESIPLGYFVIARKKSI